MAGMAGMSNRDTEVRLPRATKVKNKQAADKQVDLALQLENIWGSGKLSSLSYQFRPATKLEESHPRLSSKAYLHKC